MNSYRLGLVLSGGGARGLAHIGALKALNERDIFPNAISGTSAGAIAAVLYADGYNADEILEIFTSADLFRLVKVVLPTMGFLRMRDMIVTLKEHLSVHEIENLKLKTFVCVTNFTQGKVEYLGEGSIVKSVIASSSIPVLFKPVEMKGELYVDGGLLANLPVTPLISICERIIGIHVNPIGKFINSDRNLLGVAERTFQMATRSNVRDDAARCHWYIEPSGLSEYGLWSLKKGKEIFQIGYDATHRFLDANPIK